jgi:hypothetical protein
MAAASTLWLAPSRHFCHERLMRAAATASVVFGPAVAARRIPQGHLHRLDYWRCLQDPAGDIYLVAVGLRRRR